MSKITIKGPLGNVEIESDIGSPEELADAAIEIYRLLWQVGEHTSLKPLADDDRDTADE